MKFYQVDLCEPNPCPEPRYCVDHGNNYSCECPKGYSGPDCLIPSRAVSSRRKILTQTYSGDTFRLAAPIPAPTAGLAGATWTPIIALVNRATRAKLAKVINLTPRTSDIKINTLSRWVCCWNNNERWYNQQGEWTGSSNADLYSSWSSA